MILAARSAHQVMLHMRAVKCALFVVQVSTLPRRSFHVSNVNLVVLQIQEVAIAQFARLVVGQLPAVVLAQSAMLVTYLPQNELHV